MPFERMIAHDDELRHESFGHEYGQVPVIPRYELLGLPIHVLTGRDLISLLEQAISRGKRLVIGSHNLHSIYICHQDAQMRAFYERADCVYTDGMPVVLLARARGLPIGRKHRATFLDMINPLMERAAQNGWRIFYLGGRPGSAAKAAANLCNRFPGLHIETSDGYFVPSPGHPEDEARLSQIREYRPHILFVGMGMPRQERWIFDHLDQLEANAVLAIGGLFDYVAGEIRTPPRWMGRVGLEGFYRLLSEPRRLWKRYLIEPWFVIWIFLKWWIREKRLKGASR